MSVHRANHRRARAKPHDVFILAIFGMRGCHLKGLGFLNVYGLVEQAVWALAFGHFSSAVDSSRQIQCEYRLTHKYKKDFYTWVNVQSVDMSGCPGLGRYAFS